MGEYSRYALRGVVAGIMTGVVVSVIFVITFPTVEGLVDSLLRHQLSKQLPPDKVDEVLNNVKGVLGTVFAIAPLAQIIQYAFIGSIFGALQCYYRTKLGLSEVVSAIASGVTYTLALCVLPLMVSALVLQGIFEVLMTGNEYFLYGLSLTQGMLFTAFLVLVSVRGGPFRKFIEAAPRQT